MFRAKEAGLQKVNKQNQYQNLFIEQKSQDVQPPASYIRVTEDPVEIVRNRIDALPSFINELFNEFKSFLQVITQEQNKLSDKVI